MNARCYQLRLTDEPGDVMTVRMDVSDGEPTEDEMDALRAYFLAVRERAEAREAKW